MKNLTFCGCMKYMKLLKEYEIWMFLKSFTKVLQKYGKKVNCRVNEQNMKSIKCYRSTKFIVLQNLIQLAKASISLANFQIFQLS